MTAALLAGTVTHLDLKNAHFPNSGFLLLKSKLVQRYILLYGVLGFFCHLFFDDLLKLGAIKIEGVVATNDWVRAGTVGIAIKGLAQMTLFRFSGSGGPTPFGPSTIMNLFEPTLPQIICDVDNPLQKYLAPFLGKYADLPAAKLRVEQNIPTKLPASFRESLKEGMDRATTLKEVMELALESLGRDNFERIFPVAEARPARPLLQRLRAIFADD